MYIYLFKYCALVVVYTACVVLPIQVMSLSLGVVYIYSAISVLCVCMAFVCVYTCDGYILCIVARVSPGLASQQSHTLFIPVFCQLVNLFPPF